MSEFFILLQTYNQFSQKLADALDWFLDDARFQNHKWDKTAKNIFTKKLKKIDGFTNQALLKKTKRVQYPKMNSKANHKKKPYAVFSSYNSIGEDFVRHIRNGIAHGNISIYQVTKNKTKEFFVQIQDFYHSKQTAFIAMPLDYLTTIKQVFEETIAK